MQQLENIHPSQIKDFFREICKITISQQKKYHQFSHQNIKLQKEKEIPFQKYKKGKFQSENVDELKQHIKELEQQLQETKQERDRAIEQNRNKISDLNLALLSIKTKTEELLHIKRQRERRITDLEKKISKKLR